LTSSQKSRVGGTRALAHSICKCKFSCKPAFARGPCAFRPRRLAESERPGLAGAGFLWQAQRFEHLDKSSCNAHVHFDCAGWRKVRVRSLGRDIFPVNFRANVPSCDVHLHSECLWHCLAGVQTSWSACRGCARSNRPATGDSSLMPLLLASWLIWLPTNPHNRAVGTLASRCWSYCLSRLTPDRIFGQVSIKCQMLHHLGIADARASHALYSDLVEIWSEPSSQGPGSKILKMHSAFLQVLLGCSKEALV